MRPEAERNGNEIIKVSARHLGPTDVGAFAESRRRET